MIIEFEARFLYKGYVSEYPTLSSVGRAVVLWKAARILGNVSGRIDGRYFKII